MRQLTDHIDAVVGSAEAEKLEKLGITTVGELLYYPPRRYVGRGAAPSDSDAPEAGEWYSLVGTIVKADILKIKSGRGQMLRLSVEDGRRTFGVTFFNPARLRGLLLPGVQVLAGEVKVYQGRLQLTHPQWMVIEDKNGDPGPASNMLKSMRAAERESAVRRLAAGEPVGAEADSIFGHGIMPMYAASKEVQTWDIWAAIRQVLAEYPAPAEALSPNERSERGLIPIADALHKLHLPQTKEDIVEARRRLKYDEALVVQTVLAQRRLVGRNESAPACRHVPGGAEDTLRDRLPFSLTEGQELVLAEVGEQLALNEPMSRLLQGEVGSGKTLVALLAMLRVVDNSRQCALLAPTEVLAAQHHRTITTMLGELAEVGTLTSVTNAVGVSLLTGSMRTKGKRQTLLDVVTGSAGIVIGTHALLEDHVEFFDLGMVVVDEQHRFGVEQRDVLRGRGKDGMWPHFLVMTATPIPRTVAMTAYGDLDTSVLLELPRGRQPITTSVVPEARTGWAERAWLRAAEEVEAGRQVYVVCSRIGDDPVAAAKAKVKAETDGVEQPTSLVDQFDIVQAGPLGKYRVAMLHGRMPAEEKAEVMDGFARGEIDVLVATTVIEVGVDVPNATMMVIIDAERFGISQLHQLRGRIGRGQHPSLCLLMTRVQPNSPSMKRLAAVERTTDGFELAREDLIHRREGDVLGSLQSGSTTSLRFLSLLEDGEILADARELAFDVVASDIALADHPALASLVDDMLAPSKAAYLDKS